MDLVVTPAGTLRAIYSEAIDLIVFGPVIIRRASQVEPDHEGRWWADLRPVAGPVLGPFVVRSEALDAEVAWLEARWLDGTPVRFPRPDGRTSPALPAVEVVNQTFGADLDRATEKQQGRPDEANGRDSGSQGSGSHVSGYGTRSQRTSHRWLMHCASSQEAHPTSR
jgi:hypothetical protein